MGHSNYFFSTLFIQNSGYYLLFPGSGILKTYPGNRKRSRNDYRFAY